MQNILVTGGAGFIGSNFVRFLLQREPDLRVVNLDALTYAGSLENLKNLPGPECHVFIRGDICDSARVEAIFREHQIDTVAHFAAETHVDRSIDNPGAFIQANIVGTFTLLEVARHAWGGNFASRRFHHISTDEVFGTLTPDAPPFNESTPYQPNSPYSASKASSDFLVRAYAHTYGLPVTISNCSNNYGPYQFPEKLIPVIVVNALQGNPLPIYGDGQQVRDWLFVEDHAEAIWKILRDGVPGQTYNIGGDNQPTNLELVTAICEILDEFSPASAPHARLIQFVADRPGHDRRYAMNIDKIRAELGWNPRHSLKDGLRKTIEWYLSHLDWLENIMDGRDFQAWMVKNYARRQKP